MSEKSTYLFLSIRQRLSMFKTLNKLKRFEVKGLDLINLSFNHRNLRFYILSLLYLL